MKIATIIGVCLITACGGGSGGGGDDDDAGPAPMEAEVTVEATLLQPVDVIVATGGTVTWTNMDTLWHRLVSGLPGDSSVGTVFDSQELRPPNGFEPYSQFSVTFPTAGEVPYHCTEHPEIMVGKVIVR